jgi:Ion channel
MTSVRQRRSLATVLREEPSAVLLLVQLLGLLLYPFMDESPVGRAAVSLFSLVVLILAVRTVRWTPALTWVSVVLGAPIVILTLLEIADPTNTTLVLWSSLLLAAFYAYTAVGLLSYMFRDRFITADELWAVAATFTVIAWAFAHAFMAVQVIWPGSFGTSAPQAVSAVPGAPGVPLTWFEALFLSFTNLTSVGLSDILPVLPQARSIVMIEQVAGLMYVAIVISRIVGLQLARDRRRQEG